ncbi:MAG: Rdx family protein [Fimbriimonadaceae bacterium]|nr:Rdx family protein [Fimbriimonadaceae bacterium]QYK57211.1 MAG: Rdx family protein [Fimbriimonadaceae bacterium]
MFEAFRASMGAPHVLEKVVLVPGGGGIFDVKVDGATVFSKHAVGRHAEPGEVLRAIEQKTSGR